MMGWVNGTRFFWIIWIQITQKTAGTDIGLLTQVMDGFLRFSYSNLQQEAFLLRQNSLLSCIQADPVLLK